MPLISPLPGAPEPFCPGSRGLQIGGTIGMFGRGCQGQEPAPPGSTGIDGTTEPAGGFGPRTDDPGELPAGLAFGVPKMGRGFASVSWALKKLAKGGSTEIE